MVQLNSRPDPVAILEYQPRWSTDFAALNYQWIEDNFSVETHDREILDDPDRWVIGKGGVIFMAVRAAEAVGTVALIPERDNILELTKMAVAPAARGLGVGDLLMSRCVEYAASIGASKMYLESHTSLVPAISLYRKHGFVEVALDPHLLYTRANIRMEKSVFA